MADLTQNADAGIYEGRAEALKDNQSAARYWINALQLAGKEEKGWRDEAKIAVKTYEGSKKSAFNILFSNTETIKAAAYNSVPVPDIRTRFGDRNEVARQGAQVLERGLTYAIDEYDFDDTIRKAVQDAILPGRGVVWVNYEPLMRTVQDEGPDGQPISRDVIEWQMATCQRVPYQLFRRGPADQWGAVPWVAKCDFYTRDEMLKLPGVVPEAAMAVPLDSVDSQFGDDATEREKSPFKRAAVWQVWDKATRTVFYVAENYGTGLVGMIADPLGLLDFFPCPRPLMPIGKPDTLIPVTPYKMYREQAEELNLVTQRIKALVALLKYRGIRASEIRELDGIEDLDDGEFKPSDGALAALAGGVKSLSDAIWVMPINEIIQVVRELVLQREQIKQAIFELTGIADIMRGASAPSETLGAQQLKAQWGSLRVADLQKDIQRFIRDIFRLKAEIMASKFTAKTFGYINGDMLPDEVLAFLRGDIQRAYSIDIETDSTIRGDLNRSQQNMAMFLQGTAQFAHSLGNLIATPNNPMGVIPPKLALTVFASFARQFKLGKSVEDELARSMEQLEQQASQPQQPSPEQQAEQEEAKKLSRAATIADVTKRTADAAKAQGEAQGQQIENARAAATPITPPNRGFVQ